MSLKELQDDNGDPCFVDPAEVTGIQRRNTIRALCWLNFRKHERVCVRGTPREVAAALFAQEDTLKRQDVVDALTTEYRIALGWKGMSQDAAGRLHYVRFAIRSFANCIEVALDESLINTPLPEDACSTATDKS